MQLKQRGIFIVPQIWWYHPKDWPILLHFTTSKEYWGRVLPPSVRNSERFEFVSSLSKYLRLKVRLHSIFQGHSKNPIMFGICMKLNNIVIFTTFEILNLSELLKNWNIYIYRLQNHVIHEHLSTWLYIFPIPAFWFIYFKILPILSLLRIWLNNWYSHYVAFCTKLVSQGSRVNLFLLRGGGGREWKKKRKWV